MVHWYQWYVWYQNDAIPMVLLVQNKLPFKPSRNALIIIMNIPRSISQSRETSSLLHQVKTHYNSYEYSSFYKPITQNKFAFTPSKNALIIIMNILRSLSQPGKTSSLLRQVKTRYNSYEYSSFSKPTTQNRFAFTQSRNALRVTKRGRPIYLVLIISQVAASIKTSYEH